MSMQEIYMDLSSTVEIENMEVEKVKNEYGDDYFLNVSIITDDKYRKLRYTAKLKLPLRPAKTSINVSQWGATTLNLGFGELVCVGKPKIDVILEKKQDMTLDEVLKACDIECGFYSGDVKNITRHVLMRVLDGLRE